jgi:hypothetical protein
MTDVCICPSDRCICGELKKNAPSEQAPLHRICACYCRGHVHLLAFHVFEVFADPSAHPCAADVSVHMYWQCTAVARPGHHTDLSSSLLRNGALTD